MGFEKVIRRLLEYGVLAPSIYNSQPWKFSVNNAEGTLEVTADGSRIRSVETDPSNRDLYLALGACVENMALAAPALGYELKEDLFPRKGVIATLALKPLLEAVPDPLFSSMLNRQSHSGSYREGSVLEIHMDRLWALAPLPSDGKMYLSTEKGDREKLTAFLRDLSREGILDERGVKEYARWIRTEREPLDGLPLCSLGLPLSSRIRFGFLRYFNKNGEMREVARQAIRRQGHCIEAPAFLLMTTVNPDPLGYFNAGRRYTRLALTLSEIELACQALHLPVTMASAHGPLRRVFGAGEGEEPVLLLRFGQPERRGWPRTRRRPVSETLL